MGQMINTLADVLRMAKLDGLSYIVSNDRGNGDGGPHSICVDEADEYEDVSVDYVSEDDDPEAWRLAEEALQDKPEYVWVGEPGEGSSPHQMIYARG